MSLPHAPLPILIADDDALLRAIAAARLQGPDFSVQTVAGGAAAVAACALRLPGLVMLDVEMPDGDGYQACRAIRSLPGGIDVPIVMITGLDDPASIELAYEAGATDFIVKPINWTLLLHRLRYVLRGARTIEALRLSEQQNAALLQALPDGIVLLDAEGRIEHCFSPVEDLLAPEPRGHSATGTFLERIPDPARPRARDALVAALGGTAGSFEFALQSEAPALRHLECRYLPNAGGKALAIIREITARREAETRIHRLAYFDTLTSLPNREWMGEYLARSLTAAHADGATLALLYLDLDQFKRINDTLGHETGDALLRQVAQRLAATLEDLGIGEESKGMLARVGGDEFIVALAAPARREQAEQVATRMLAALATPFVQEGLELVVTPSIGVALYPEHGDDAPSLLKNADGAMYEAKAGGRNQFSFHDGSSSVRALRRLSLEMELRRAFDRSALEVHYQPKFAARGLKLIGAEALLRWFHPERGQIPTADFIAVAEETGLISDIGRWAMERVCTDLGRWRRGGIALPSIAVNVSGRDFMRPEFLLRLGQIVSDAQLPPSLFELELTEGVLMKDAETGRRALEALKEFGFTLAMDDFGTGYCSLNYLKRLPLDTLKIDRSFVEDIGSDTEGASIVRAIIALGHSLEMRIVAEGVSTEAQLAFLQAEHCDAVQGFLLSPAVPAEVLTDLLLTASPRVEEQLSSNSRHRSRDRRPS
jgi:diguanylate cyclase (GGDEF)-like protein